MAIQPPWAQILELHHSRQGAAYLKGATDTLEQLAESRDQGYLPRDGGDPDGPLRDAIDRRFIKPPSGAKRAREEIMTKQEITQFLPTEFTYADDDDEHFGCG